MRLVKWRLPSGFWIDLRVIKLSGVLVDWLQFDKNVRRRRCEGVKQNTDGFWTFTPVYNMKCLLILRQSNNKTRWSSSQKKLENNTSWLAFRRQPRQAYSFSHVSSLVHRILISCCSAFLHGRHSVVEFTEKSRKRPQYKEEVTNLENRRNNQLTGRTDTHSINFPC